jgi:hypothetical protein
MIALGGHTNSLKEFGDSKFVNFLNLLQKFNSKIT